MSISQHTAAKRTQVTVGNQQMAAEMIRTDGKTRRTKNKK
jgi:hypothetical protein